MELCQTFIYFIKTSFNAFVIFAVKGIGYGIVQGFTIIGHNAPNNLESRILPL